MDIGSIEGVSQEYPPHTASNRGDPCHPSFFRDGCKTIFDSAYSITWNDRDRVPHSTQS